MISFTSVVRGFHRRPPTVTYFARSILTSRTAQFATLTFVLGVLSLPDVVALVPLGALPWLMAIQGVIAFALRAITVRPVAFRLPGTLTPIVVEKLTPPAAAVSTD